VHRYCFGAPYVMESITPKGSSPPVCDVGAFAHPAFLKEHQYAYISKWGQVCLGLLILNQLPKHRTTTLSFMHGR
jgi:hypothetical protein